jgi:hypothetical protein
MPNGSAFSLRCTPELRQEIYPPDDRGTQAPSPARFGQLLIAPSPYPAFHPITPKVTQPHPRFLLGDLQFLPFLSHLIWARFSLLGWNPAGPEKPGFAFCDQQESTRA